MATQTLKPKPHPLDPAGNIGLFESPKRVAGLLNVSDRTLKRWRDDGTGPEWVRIGGSIRYKGASLLRWAEAQK